MHTLSPSLARSSFHTRRTPDLLERLRDCTRDRHRRLDSGMDFRRDGVTHERYVAFLRGVFAVVSPLETALARWFVPEAGASRSERLLADLDRLGGRADIVPISIRLPIDRAEAYGCAYVLEGSTLGGVALAPIVYQALGRDTPTSYLRLRAENTGRIWHAWLRKLNAFGETATHGEIEAACDMACATFDAYTESLRAMGALIEP
jgi:heme oxygenase